MAQTPLTNSSTLLTAAEFLKRIDKRTVADLVSDTGEAVDVSTLSADANLNAALLDATGEVEASGMKGGRYRPEDLAALTGAARARLHRMVARLTLVYLYERRPDKGPPAELLKVVDEQLDLLRQGEAVFGTDETHDASTMDHEVETSHDVEARNGTTFQAARFFGRRSNRVD